MSQRFAARTGIALDDAIDAEIMGRSIEAGYLTRTPDHIAATAEGRMRLDALLGALLL